MAVAIILMYNLSDKERLAYILIAVSAFFTGLGFYLEILNRRKNG